ncbi:rab GTPase-activating protein 1-like [Aplochiton taeniatus]
MMEEVSIEVAYDAHIVNQMSEEEILVCLVTESQLMSMVPSTKTKLQDVHQHSKEDDPFDKYQRENRQLQQASLRLEQENDNLAHRLVTSKIALRNALDQTEDRIDGLTEDLLKTRIHLKATEEEKRAKEEESAMLKEMFRGKLEKAEQEVKRSSGIISDYKQICARLTGRLEKQQLAHSEELDKLKIAVLACSRCRQALEPENLPNPGVVDGSPQAVPGLDPAEQDQAFHNANMPDQGRAQRKDSEKETLAAEVRELEQELVQTKLQMVEANCKIQELEHERGILASELQTTKNNWFDKTFTSLRSTSGKKPL